MPPPKPTPPQVVDLRLLPALMRWTRPEYKRWVGWNYEWAKKPDKEGKWTKVPYQLDGSRKAASTRPGEWSGYEDIWEQYRARRFDGIGMMLRGLDDFGSIDLDKVRVPTTGELMPWVDTLITGCGSYCEITPSLGGLRVLGRWGGGEVHRNGPHPEGGKFELFAGCARYITFTGMANGTAERWGDITLAFGGLLALLDNKKETVRPNGIDDDAMPIDIETLSLGAIDLITKGTIDGQGVSHRGPLFQKVVGEIHSRGHSLEAALALLARYPQGIHAKYGARLRTELTRSWGKAEQFAAARAAPPRTGVSLDDFWAYMPQHNYIYAPAREPWPGASINARINPIPVGCTEDGKEKTIPASAWLDRNKPVEQLTWAPGMPQIIENRLISEGGWIQRNNVSCFNLYRPPTIAPGDGKKAQHWLKHVMRVFPADYEHIVGYLAHRVQRPQEKINHALVLGGKQGIGKDTLLEPARRAVGIWNFREISPRNMFEPFNDFLRSIILRISEARDLGEFDRFKFYDHMKTYTAAPPDVLRVNEKYLRQYTILNCCSVIITTNDKTNGIYLPADDRRHYVAWSDLDKADFKQKYWNLMWKWYDGGGDRDVAAYLAQYDISGFDAKAPPPKTPAFWEIVAASGAAEDAELADVLDDLGRPDTVTLAEISAKSNAEFSEWLSDRKNARRIPHRLEACGYVAVRNDGAKDGFWKVDGRRQVIYGKAEIPAKQRFILAAGRAGARSEVREF